MSKPTFDPNLFVEGIDQENWQALNESINKPLLNRALRGTYPPGSTYKPFMALAALELKKRAAHTVVNDPGFYTFGGRTFRSHEGGLGGVDMVRAIQFSSNTYFYSLGVEMGVDTIHDFMAPFGFGQITGVDLGGEVRGVLPSTAWKRATYKRPETRRWYQGETVSLGIGQGYNNFTMLQLALAQATLVNGGIRYRPHVGKAVRNAVTGEITPIEQPPGHNLGFAAKNIEVVLRGLVAVNEAGTGRRVFVGAPYSSGGKTGTAQAVSLGQNVKYNAKALEEHKRDHSLFAAFAPADNPRIAVALIVENAGFGAASAAPITRRVFDYWLLGLYPSEEDIAATAKGLTSAPIGTPRQAHEVELATVSEPRP